MVATPEPLAARLPSNAAPETTWFRSGSTNATYDRIATLLTLGPSPCQLPFGESTAWAFQAECRGFKTRLPLQFPLRA